LAGQEPANCAWTNARRLVTTPSNSCACIRSWMSRPAD
jgi:hypothetical protein